MTRYEKILSNQLIDLTTKFRNTMDNHKTDRHVVSSILFDLESALFFVVDGKGSLAEDYIYSAHKKIAYNLVPPGQR